MFQILHRYYLFYYFVAIYEVYVEDFMITKTKHVYLGMNYGNLKNLLINNKKLTVFPLVDNPQTMTLLGSVTRKELISLLENKIGVVKRREILPSPKITRYEDEDVVEIIPMRKKSNIVQPVITIDDSSDSEKEDSKEETVTVASTRKRKDVIKLDERPPSIKEETEVIERPGVIFNHLSIINSYSIAIIFAFQWRDDILKKWAVTKRKKLPPLSKLKSPMPGRKSATHSASNLEVVS